MDSTIIALGCLYGIMKYCIFFLLLLDLPFFVQSQLIPKNRVEAHTYNGSYTGPNRSRVAFPVGGMGAGMICLEGSGAISHVSLHHTPDLYNEPLLFAAIAIKGQAHSARVLEGPVPGWKIFGPWDSGSGEGDRSYGLARFRNTGFLARFPFAEITLTDPEIPLEVRLTGWSPFIPTDADNSSLPVGALEYHFTNRSHHPLDCIFSFNARNIMAMTGSRGGDSIGPTRIETLQNGFILDQEASSKAPWQRGAFAIWVDTDQKGVTVDYCWFRGGWWDPLTMAWKHIEEGQIQSVAPVKKDAPGASLFMPFTLKPSECRTIRVLLAWYVPDSHLRVGRPCDKSSDSTVHDSSRELPSSYYKPWYSSRFANIREVVNYWQNSYTCLRAKSVLFKDAFYRSSLPPEVLEAAGNNLSILKSPTVMRQYDGRFWAWEGSNDTAGSCAGTCTHVWNYAQALCHLFPEMERSIRETELKEDMDSAGHQNYRAALPIRPVAHDYYRPAADGQLGAIMRLYRDWRICGDSTWLRNLYSRARDRKSVV